MYGNWNYMMGGGSGAGLIITVLVIILLVALIRWVWKLGNKK